jgi:FecR protein
VSDTFALLADAYLDDALDEAQAERLLTYLRDSPAAREHLQALAAIDHGLRGMAGNTTADAAARLAVLARIRSSGSSKRFRLAVEQQLTSQSPKPRALSRWSRRLRPRQRWSALVAAALVIIVIGYGWQMYATPALPAIDPQALAVIETLDGWVTVQHADEDETIRAGHLIKAGEVVITGENAGATLRLHDGTRLALAAGGTLRLPARDGARAGLERGTVVATVTPQAPNAAPVLSTNNASIRVLGTQFSLSAEGDHTGLRVSHGVVALRTHDGHEWQVQRGESLQLDGTRLEHTRPLTVRRKPGDAWYDGNARTLADVPGISTPASPTVDAWGGRRDRTLPTSGGFSVRKDQGRWWLVDPAGHPLISTGVSNVRPVMGKDNPGILAHFGNLTAWHGWAGELLSRHGVTTIGSESDHLALTASAASPAAVPPTAVVAWDIAQGYAKRITARNPKLARDADAKSTLKLLAPLMPGFSAYLTTWESTARADISPAVLGVVTDRHAGTALTWPLLARLAAADGEVRLVLETWLAHHQQSLATADNALLVQLRSDCLQAYHDQIYPAVRRVAPNALLFGQILGLNVVNDPDYVAHLCRDIDAVAISLIGQWLEDAAPLRRIEERLGKPIWIDSFYAKGVDSGLPNRDGNGLEVATQADRGRFYQHLALLLLESRVVIGWQWFRFEDVGEGPFRTMADYNSNKGIVSPAFVPHEALLKAMAEVNRARYTICDYFDRLAP